MARHVSVLGAPGVYAQLSALAPQTALLPRLPHRPVATETGVHSCALLATILCADLVLSVLIGAAVEFASTQQQVRHLSQYTLATMAHMVVILNEELVYEEQVPAGRAAASQGLSATKNVPCPVASQMKLALLLWIILLQSRRR